MRFRVILKYRKKMNPPPVRRGGWRSYKETGQFLCSAVPALLPEFRYRNSGVSARLRHRKWRSYKKGPQIKK